MEVDSDIDGGLLQQFSCLGTTDRDVLISELQKLLGYQLNAAGCAFFLDMNNWNLQAAICSYFDFESPYVHLPAMSLVKDITVGEGEAVPPATRFIKTWRLHNPSAKMWPPGCSLRLVSGERMGHSGSPVLVDPLGPRAEADVSVHLVSPSKPGIYQAQWRMATATGHYFGEVIWVIVTVAEGGLLGVTQQMEAFHHLGSPPRLPYTPAGNPFALANPPTTETAAVSSESATAPEPSPSTPSLSQLSPTSPIPVPEVPKSSDDMVL